MSDWLDKYVSNLKDSSANTNQPRSRASNPQPTTQGDWLDSYIQQTQTLDPISETKDKEEEDTLIERTFGKNALTDFLGDLYRAGASGVAAGETTGESFDMFQEAGNKELTDESIQKYIGAVEYAKNQDVTNEMKDFQRIYEEEGESLAGFFKGVAANPSILPQMLVSSFGTLGGSLFDSEEVAGFALAGAAVGSQIPIIGTAIGGFTGLTTAMETGLTYSELLQDKLAEDGLEFNTENIRKILENDEVRQSIMNKSLGRGLAIGAVEALTAGFASKATRGVSAALRSSSKRASTAAAIGANVAVESTGGGLGEVLGRVAAGQEMDVAEIGFEAITGTTTTPITLARGLRKGGQYTQKSKNGDQPMTRKQVVDFLETANDEEIVSANIEIKNDPEISEMARQKQDVILLKARIDDKITDESDRKKLLNLEQQRQEAEGKTTTYFKNKLKRINKSIDEITNKYLDAEEEVADKKSIETNLTDKDLSEGETIVDSEKDKKGRNVTRIAKSSEKDGVKTTKFTFNRDDKPTSQRNADGVSPEVALGDNYEVDSESIPKGSQVSKVFEIREGKTSVGATVEFTSENGKSIGEVVLNKKTTPTDPKASRDIVDKAVKRDTIEKATATRRAAADAEFVKSFGAQERSFDNAEQVLKDVDELNKTLPKDQKIKISKEDRKAMDEVGGFYNAANNVVYINKEVASKMKNVGAHEVLHGILFKHVGDASKQKVLVDNFKNQISTKQKDDIEAYMSKRGYDVSIDEQGNNTQEYYEEYLSNFSDAVVDGVVKFDENVFTKIGDLIAPILRAAGFNQISFDTGRGVYNFMREYNKSIEKGRLSKPISSFLDKREKEGKTLNQKQLNTVQNAISNISKSADKRIPKAIKEKRSSVNFKKIAKTLDLKGITNEQLKELENNKGFTEKTRILSKSIIDSDLDPLDAFNEITKDNDTYTELQKRVVKLLIDNGLLKNRFERYGGVLEEIRVINATEQNNKKKGNGRITIKKEGVTGYDPTSPDIQLVYKDSLGKETSLNIEVKKDQKADFSSRTISRVLDDNGNVKYEISNDDSNNGLLLSALQSLLEPKRDNNGEIIKGQEGIMNAFFDFVDKKTGKKSNRILGTGVESIPLKVYEQWKNFENKNPDKKVGRTFSSKGEGKSKIDYSVDNIAKVYNDKGNYYIEIGGKGLYFLGMSDGSTNNMNIFNAPYLDDQGILNVRLRISFSRSKVDKDGMVKPRMRASFQIGVGKGNILKPSKLSITNQETLNKSYDKLAERKSTDNLSESKKSTVNKSKETKTEQEGEDIEGAFNGILEDTKGVDAKTRYSDSMAKLMGKKSGRFAFIPPSAEDFMGLIYSFLGKGELGERQKRFFETYLNAPYKRGVAALESAKQRIHEGYRLARKNNPEARKKLSKKVPGQPFTYDQAVRMYIWKNQGTDLSGIGLNEKEIADLVKIVESDQSISKFANDVSSMQGIDGQYPPPGEFWLTENIASDLNNAIDKIGRKKFLKEFIDNRKQIFSKNNLNKIEAIYGSNFRDALEDIMTRMETGSNRPSGSNKQVNKWLNWINGSVGAIMFLNMKSASLQLISFVNYLNWNDNNPLNAAATFANPKQFAADFAMIFQSDKLKQRRLGTKISVSESELSSVAEGSGNAYKNVFNYLIKLGFKPTQIADSVAISFGGASMYRNRVNSNLKQGMSLKEAEKAAFEDFSAITEETQQSSDPRLISQQQSGPLGRIILAFANTPAQYARLTKKAILDLANNRGDWKTNVSKIVYYAAIQNIIFSGMQTALFAMMFDDDSDEDEINEKEVMALNSMVDSLLRGSGVGGAALATVKNAIMEYHEQEKKKFFADHTHTLIQLTSVSPPISSKLRNIYSAILTTKYNKDVIEAKGFAIDQPLYRVGAKVIEAGTNVPLDRVMNKISNFSQIKEDEFKTWQRIMLALGWSTWSLGLKNQEHELIKVNARDARDKERYKKAAATRKKNRESESLKERRKKSRDRLKR
jgi:hypothetical protein